MRIEGLLPSRPAVRRVLTAVLVAAALAWDPVATHSQDADGVAPAAIGEPTRDLTFSPVPRCRVLDTRVEGGRLSAGIPRHFDVADTLAGQGGAPDCLVPFGAAVVLIRVAPIQAHGPGTLTTWAFGGLPQTGNTVRFSLGARAARTVIPEILLPICSPAVASCTHDITLRADGSDTDVIADVAGYFAAPAVPWSAISGKPAGFADNVDNDTQYSAGTGLLLNGTVFGVDTSTIQARVAQTCAAGSAMRVVNANGTVTCEPDDNTTYAAGTGLSLTGTTFNVNSSVVQNRVTDTCAAGSSIRAIGAAGAVTCETDNDTNTTYTAGSGLTLTGTTFSVNTNETQDRVTGTCTSAIRTINANGTVACGPTVQAGRDVTGAQAVCPTVTTITFNTPFSGTPSVVVTPEQYNPTSTPPNTYCAIDDTSSTSFDYCCYGNIPTWVNWIAIR